MRPARLAAALVLTLATALGFAGWMEPANVLAVVSTLPFCQ